MGYLDEDGFLYIIGRKNHMINFGGINIFPEEIESVLALHTFVEEAAVTKVADHYWGQIAVAVIKGEVTGVHPFYPAIAPVSAIQAILARQAFTVDDIDLFEINEAFAVKIAACAKELSIPLEKINIRGGAIPMGHPYGGGGIGMAVLFEAIH